MDSANNSTSRQNYGEIDECSEDEIVEKLNARTIWAVRERGAGPFEMQTLMLQYRNLETSIRLGLL
jgi:hypothetical protein